MKHTGCCYSAWNLFPLLTFLLSFLHIQMTSATDNIPSESADQRVLQASDITANTVTLTWNTTRESEIISLFQLTLLEHGNKTSNVFQRDNTTTTITIRRLHPCLDYDVILTALNTDGQQIGNNSTVHFKSTYRAPPPVLKLSTTNITAWSLALSWERPDTGCNITAYNITVVKVAQDGTAIKMTVDGSSNFNGTAVIVGLQPYSKYNVTVTASNEAGEGEGVTINATTGQEVPSPPTEVQANSISATAITVSWKEPRNHYGVLGNYSVYWYNNTDLQGSGVVDTPHYTITGLSPCVEYTVIVKATTAAGEGEGTEKKITTVGDNSQPCCSTDINTQTILVTWNKPNLLWPITYYEVSWPNGDATVDHSTHYYTLSHSTGLEQSQICVRAVGGKELGDRRCCGPTSPETKKTKEKTGQDWTGIIVVVASAGAMVVAVLLLVAAIVKRDAIRSQLCPHQKERESAPSPDQRGRSSSDSLNQSESNLLVEDDRLVTSRNWQRRPPSDVVMPELTPEEIGLTEDSSDMIRADNLIYSVYSVSEEYYSDMQARVKHQLDHLKDPARVAAEFDQLNKESFIGETSAGQLPVNMRKNRYSNIIPFDSNRVRLRNAPDNTTDYINASFVQSSVAEDVSFIACQSPKANTVSDFWWMVWEQNIRIIVMLVRSDEGEKTKCTQYWPILCEQSFSTLVLKTESKESMGGLIVRNMILRNEGESRAVRHFQFISWPDFGVPYSENELLMLVKEIREHIQPPMRNIVVHCSAGVGRTGTFIALWQLQVQAERRMAGIDVRETVLQLRRHREMLVQKPEQYYFLFSCFLKYLQEMNVWKPALGPAHFSETSGLTMDTAV